MINIVNSIDLSALLSQLINDIKASWNNPFKSPVVVFPNSKLEQWFKYNWLKNTSNGVLMNLEYARMESFLFECVGGSSKSLSRDLLRDLIIAKLEEKENGQFYFETLGNDFVNAYLKDGDKINDVHLFDFASQMADLFADYEVDMLDWDAVSSVNKDWEKKLYDAVMAKGVELVYQLPKSEEKRTVVYKTLYEAYKTGDFHLPEKYKDRPVFVFGFSGMGQIHREIIKKIAETNVVTVYLQYDADANVPNGDWALNGKAEYDEWSSFVGKDNYLLVKSEQKSPVFTLAAAPSKLREVEVLHSEICKLINDHGVKPSDILVVAPNIGDYGAEIDHIFELDSKLNLPYIMADGFSRDSLVNSAFSVLYTMLFKGSLMRNDLFSLLRNPVVQQARGFNDTDVDNWLSWVEKMNVFRNGVNIDDWEKAKTRLLVAKLTDEKFTDSAGKVYLPFQDMVSESNATLAKYIRVVDDAKKWCDLNRKERIDKDDVDEIENLLAAFLHMDGVLEENLECERFVYAGIRSAINQQRMLLNCGVQTSLSFRCFMLALKDAIQEVNVVKGLAYLDGMTFTSMKPNRVMTADYVFMLGMDSKHFPGVQKFNALDVRAAKAVEKQLPAQNKNTFLCQLMATGKELHISYVNRDLQKDDVFYPASVVNDLNISEKKYDIDETREKADLFTSRSRRNKKVYEKLKSNQEDNAGSKSETDKQGDDSSAPDRVSLSNLRSFLEDPFQAYVNRMLGTNDDEEDAEIENSEFEPIEFDNKILESRLRKEYIKKIFELVGDIFHETQQKNAKYDREQSDIKNQISELDVKIDELKEKLKDKTLEKSVIQSLKAEKKGNESKKEELKAREKKIKNDKEENTQKISDLKKNYTKVIGGSAINKYKQNLVSDLLAEGVFRDAENAKDMVDNLATEGDNIYKAIAGISGLDISNIVFDENIELRLSNWLLSGTMEWHVWQSEDELHVIEIYFRKNRLKCYVTALAVLASKTEDPDKEVAVVFHSFDKNSKADNKKPTTFQLSPNSAKELLGAIYKKAFTEKYHKCVRFADVKTGKHSFKHLAEFISDLRSGDWKYFQHKHLINTDRDLGYNRSTFVTEYNNSISELKLLIAFLNNETEDNQN